MPTKTKKEAPRYCARCGGHLGHNPNHLRLRHNRYRYSESSTEVFYLCGRCADRVERLLRAEFELYRGREVPDLPTRQDRGQETRQVTLEGERAPRALRLAYSSRRGQ